MRLRPAFAGHDVCYVTVDEAYQADVPGERFRTVNDATRWDRAALCRMAARIGWIVLREQPDVIISTGAAPGYFAIRLGRLIGARSIWVDSIANAERLSMSGERVGRFADLWLTQWPHLAHQNGPQYTGAVL
jgi:UDP-N-acetylglucosamine:LPS N-acetylglucosamine transferase